MTAPSLIQAAIFLAALLLLVKPLGWYMARVYQVGPHAGRSCGLDRVLGPLERTLYRLAGVRPEIESDWRRYALGTLSISALGVVALILLQRLQQSLPANPASLAAVAPDLSLNTAISFVTNTNWQSYGGETTLSPLTQMLGLGVQNFLSAATGMAVLVALLRGIARRRAATIGNFWVDLTRGTLYVLLPLSVVLAVILVGQGVVQSLAAPRAVLLIEPTALSDGTAVLEQSLPLGPAASQVAIKQLGTNGGGFFNVNSAHPFENPTPLSNFLQLLAILLIPAALCWTLGETVGDRRQGWALFAAMLAIFLALLLPCLWAEQRGNPMFDAAVVDAGASATQPGGNMEGKESRFGIGGSVLWAVATTAASNGSVNSMHDSYTPLGGLVPMWLMQLGEVVFGGVGSGLYGMLMFVLVAVFVAGLMVGRAPEYLGKKIEPFEMKMASIAILLPCALVLAGTALATLVAGNAASVTNPGPHGFSQMLYAFSSASNNNGSAFAGYGANTPFNNAALAICMFLGRFGVMIPVLAVAGSLARKNAAAPGVGTLPTHTPLFVALLVGVVVIVGALTFVPALALGPVVEELQGGRLSEAAEAVAAPQAVVSDPTSR